MPLKKIKTPNTSLATQSNKLIEASYKMSIPAKRVMLMLLGQIHPGQQDVSKKIRIEAADYAEKTGISFDKSYSDIKNGCRELMHTIITTKNPQKRTTEECVVVHWMKYHENEGWLEATFTPWIAPFIHHLAKIGYSTITIDEALKFKRFYTIRLYELLMQWEYTGMRIITLENLRFAFQIEKKSYPLYKDFRVRVLEPSLRELEEKTIWRIKYTPVKTGRQVTSLKFFFRQDKQQQLNFE